MLMLAGMVLAWPEPSGMLPVALLSFVVLSAVAVFFEAPAAHALAGACLAIAYLLGYQVASGGLAWAGGTADQARAVLLSTRSGAALVPLVLSMLVLVGGALRWKRRAEAEAYAAVTALAFVASVGLATVLGFGRAGDPAGASWILGAYAAAALVSAGWFGRNPLVERTSGRPETIGLAWLGSVLGLMALVQWVVFGARGAVAVPWVVAGLAHATLALVLAEILGRFRKDGHPVPATIRGILARSALATSFLSAALLLLSLPEAGPSSVALRASWLSAVWLALAWRRASPALFGGSQAAITGAVGAAVVAVLARRPWFASERLPWLDPWSLQAQALALSALCGGWIALRIAVHRAMARRQPPSALLSTANALLEPPWPAFDRVLRGFLVAIVVAMAIYGVAPDVAREMSPRDLAARLAGTDGLHRVVPPASAFEISGIPHDHALQIGSWLVLVAVMAVLLAGQWERFRRLDLLGALVVGTMAAPLAAGRWGPDVAAASALRWTSALAFLAVAILNGFRDRLADRARRLGWAIGPEQASGLPRLVAGTAIALALLPLASLGAFVAGASLASRPVDPDLSWIWGEAAILFVTLAGAGLIARIVTDRRFGLMTGAGPSWRGWVRPGGTVAALVGALPLLAVSVYLVGSSLQGNPIVGTEPGSFFRRLGDVGSFVPPILVLAAGLVAFATRERSSSFAFSAGLVLGVAATVGVVIVPSRSLDAVLWARLFDLNAIVASSYALAWMGTIAAWRRRNGEKGPTPLGGLLGVMVGLGLALGTIVLVVATAGVIVDPWPHVALKTVAGAWGWGAVLLITAAVLVRSRLSGRAIPEEWLGAGLLGASAFLAMGQAFRDSGNWSTYHALMAALAASGIVLPGIALYRGGMRFENVGDEARSAAVTWSSVALGLVAVMSFRAYGSDPISSGWSVGGLVASVAVAAILAAMSGNSAFSAVGGILLNVAATFWCLDAAWWKGSRGWGSLADLLDVNIVALAAPVAGWLWIDRRFSAPRRASTRVEAPLFPSIALRACLAALAFVVLISLAADAATSGDWPRPLLGWLALAATASALASGLWDGRRRGPVAGLYGLGLIASGWVIGQFHLPPGMLLWTGTTVLAAYSVGTSYLWSRRDGLRLLADRLGIPVAEVATEFDGLGWLVPASLATAAAVLALAFGSILSESSAFLRAAAAHAALAEVLALGLLARGAGGRDCRSSPWPSGRSGPSPGAGR